MSRIYGRDEIYQAIEQMLSNEFNTRSEKLEVLEGVIAECEHQINNIKAQNDQANYA